MYEDRICRTNPNRHPQFFIRRSEIAFDERVAYIESVCAVLIESRFGPGRVPPVVINLSDRPELERAVFYDLSEDEPIGLVPCYSLSPLGRAGYQVVEAAYGRAKQLGLVADPVRGSHFTAESAPNQGRGSP